MTTSSKTTSFAAQMGRWNAQIAASRLERRTARATQQHALWTERRRSEARNFNRTLVTERG